jgi:hypothetical protein
MASLKDKSPFPGMDPYVESPRHWQDFHHRFIDDLSDAISERLPENYVARIEQDVLMVAHDDEELDKLVGPDLTVSRTVGQRRSALKARSGGGTSVLEPVVIPNVERLDPLTEGFIEIRRLPDQELVTVIEVLSRTNKSKEGRAIYLEKRERLLRQPISLVEIDLLRSGRRLELAKPLPPGHYYAFVSRVDRKPLCDVFAWSVRDALPAVQVPLDVNDGPVKVPLGAPFDRTFRRGRYLRLTDYSEPPPAPSFSREDAKWIASITATVAH